MVQPNALESILAWIADGYAAIAIIETIEGEKMIFYWQENCLNCTLNGVEHIPDGAGYYGLVLSIQSYSLDK